MARAKENPWIPSGGVLVVAVVAAVIAAILLNVYIGTLKSPYEDTVTYLVVKQSIARGDTIERDHLGTLEIATAAIKSDQYDAMSRFVPVADIESALREKARWDLRKGNLLAYRDFLKESGVPVMPDIPEDYQMMTIEIEPEPSVQPGVFVTISGYFDLDPDPKRENILPVDILEDVKVLGPPDLAEKGHRSADHIQIALPPDLRQKLQALKQKMEEAGSKRFMVAVRQKAEGIKSEPTLAPDARDLLRKEAAGLPIPP